jgi:hypothetical protein
VWRCGPSPMTSGWSVRRRTRPRPRPRQTLAGSLPRGDGKRALPAS